MSDIAVKPPSANVSAAPSACGCCACPSGSAVRPDAEKAGVNWEIWGGLACALLTFAGWGGYHLALPALYIHALYFVAVVAGGWPLLCGSWRAIGALALDMNVLMSIAAIGACWLGDWGEAASLVFLYSVSEWIERQSVRRSRRAIANLMSLTPPRALVRQLKGKAQDLIEVDANEVAVGDIFVVRAGERIALDGVITEGHSQVNQAPVTGESLPVEKGIGDEVFAGTLNDSGVLEARATRLAQDGTLAHIARLVGEAEAQKSPRQRTMESFARLYTPVIIAVAATVAIMPPLIFGANWHSWFYRALSLLVAACPCAFVLSGPIAAICAISAAARRGILIRGGTALETLAAVQAVAFDKTGTITEGVPHVTDFITLNGQPRDQLIAVAGALEQQSQHPLARAVVDFARREVPSTVVAENVQEQEGQGVSGTYEGTRYHIGRIGLAKAQLDGAAAMVQSLQSQGRSVALLNGAGKPLAVIGFTDKVRASASSGLLHLQAQGIAPRIILSGDNTAAVRHVTEQVGADSYQSELMPADKLRIIREFGQQHGTTAMVGDGINDAPALAQADIGVAMGAAGSDAALEVSDVALMSDDLNKLPEAIAIARQARSIIMQNIALALAMKFIFIVGLFLNLWGSYSLAGGVIADMGATLLVTANALRLLQSHQNN
ncbi:MAG: heavy metal translocating P-type ATPase [Abitibacteriaceae bacterium]|nr:heavy metal translocating P-type ATPase [Abditibacteriaceae bacterium]